MAKTRTDLIHRTLRNLGVLPMGQSPNAEESQQIDDLIDTVLENLHARSVCLQLVDADYIDDALFLPISRVMAAEAAPEFGLANDVSIYALKERAELDLKKITVAAHMGQVLPGEYY
jgi:hypothetical protein